MSAKTELSDEMKTAMRKDIAAMGQTWLLAGHIADEEMRDAAIAQYKAYVDMFADAGVSIAQAYI